MLRAPLVLARPAALRRRRLRLPAPPPVDSLGKDGRSVTAADLARIYGVSVRTIRRWAHDDNWRRRRSGQTVIYNLTDFDRSWRKRREPSATEVLKARLAREHGGVHRP